MKIANFTIDNNSSVFIIAELSANHNGSLSIALETIRAAKRAGADAVKIQTYTADTITIDCDKDDFLIKELFGTGGNYMTYIKMLIHLGNGTKKSLIVLKRRD